MVQQNRYQKYEGRKDDGIDQHFGSILSQVSFWSLTQLSSKTVGRFSSGAKYSRMDQVKLWKTAFKKIEI